MANLIKLAKGDFLMQEGDKGENMYLVQKGQLEVTRHKNGENIVLGHIYTGELVGEMSFLDGKPRSASVKAVSEVELVEVPRDVFEKIIEAQPVWFRALVRTLTERLRKANARVRI